jgi:sugar-specific transcriptional regulator TrmB
MKFNPEIKKELEIIGLNDNEAKIYLFLSNSGESSAGPIIKELGLHRNVIYTSLNHMIDKKIVSEKNMRGKKIFTSLPLNTFVENLKFKQEIAEKLSTKIEILNKSSVKEISIHEGNIEYLNLLSSLIKKMKNNSEKYVIGTGGELFMKNTMRPIWKAYHKVVIDKNIKIKMIAYEHQKKALTEDIEKYKEYYEIKYLTSGNENPGGIHIYPSINTVLNIIYSNEYRSVVAIKIEDESLSVGYKNLFDSLWNN